MDAKKERNDTILCNCSFSVSRRAVINMSAACVALLVLLQAVSWREARRSYLAAARFSPRKLRSSSSGAVQAFRAPIKLPKIPGWKGKQSQLSGRWRSCCVVCSVPRRLRRVLNEIRPCSR